MSRKNLYRHAAQALRQQMDILQAQLSALQALQTSAPQPSLPVQLQGQPASAAAREQPAGGPQPQSEASGSAPAAGNAPSAGESPSTPGASAASVATSGDAGTAQSPSGRSEGAEEPSPEEQMRRQRLQRFNAGAE